MRTASDSEHPDQHPLTDAFLDDEILTPLSRIPGIGNNKKFTNPGSVVAVRDALGWFSAPHTGMSSVILCRVIPPTVSCRDTVSLRTISPKAAVSRDPASRA